VEEIPVNLPDGLRIARLREKDVPAWLPMVDAQTRHMARSPAFVPYLEQETSNGLADFLKQPGNRAWIAWDGNEPVGYMRVTPIGNGAAWIVNGDRKFAINGAYVNPEFRCRGIARALLSEIMDWGLENGFIRCSVDFEATNPEACQFWLRHFQPVCRSMIRRFDERILKTI
jgi:GNAT superfamily N-acetyltransferase